MRRILKFQLGLIAAARVAAASPGDVVHVGEQFGGLCAWVLVDESQPAQASLVVRGTGDYAYAGEEHVGTAQMSDGLVWHVFWRAGAC